MNDFSLPDISQLAEEHLQLVQHHRGGKGKLAGGRDAQRQRERLKLRIG